MKARKTSARVLSLLLVVAMLMTFFAMAVNVSAEDPDELISTDLAKTGSVKVTKYKTTSNATNTNPYGTGVENNGNAPFDATAYETLEGATFRLYPVLNREDMIRYYSGNMTRTLDLNSFSDFATTTNNPPVNDPDYTHITWFNIFQRKFNATDPDDADLDLLINTTNTTDVPGQKYYEQTTGPDGTLTFAALPLGLYVLVEVTAPTNIVSPLAVPCLVSVPMVNSKTSENDSVWKYDVFVYPKNHTAEGSITITKNGKIGTAVNPLEDTKFIIEQKRINQGGTLESDWTSYGAGFKLTDSDGTVSFTNLPANLYGTHYRIYEDATTDGYVTDRRPIEFIVKTDNTIEYVTTNHTGLVTTAPTIVDGNPTTTANITNYEPTLDKTVQKGNTDTGFDEGGQYNIGDTITYQLKVYVPENLSDLDHFILKENVDATQLKLDPSDKAVKIDYGVPSTTLDKTWDAYFKIDFAGFTDPEKALVKGKEVTITYTAQLLKDAVIGETGNMNTAEIIYSKYINDTEVPAPSDPTAVYTISDSAAVYTYSLDLTKYLDDTSSAKGVGVEFNLLKGASKTPVKLFEDPADTGNYRLPVTAAEVAAADVTLKVPASGLIRIYGLENETYYMRETQTVAGYNMLANDLKYVLDYSFRGAVDKTSPAPAFAGNVKQQEESTADNCGFTAGDNNMKVINKKGFTLPQTGSMGYLLFCTAGVVLILGGAMLMFGSRKKVIR